MDKNSFDKKENKKEFVYSGGESDGERAVRVALENMGVEYVQEKKIDFLFYDDKNNRYADFFLPRYNVYIEYLGGWNKSNKQDRENERNRYLEKMAAYELEGINCIYIYPYQLNFISKVLHDELSKFEKKKFYEIPVSSYFLFFSFIPLFILTIFLFFINFLLGFFVFLVSTILILKLYGKLKSYECPNCNLIGVVEKEKSFVYKHKKVPWVYKIENRYYYSDGTYKNSTFSDYKTRFENVFFHKHIYKCKSCGYKWAKYTKENVDIHSRPKTVYHHRTRIRNPSSYSSSKKTYKKSGSFIKHSYSRKKYYKRKKY